MISLVSNGAYWQASWKDSLGRRQRKGLGPKATISKAAARRMIGELAKQVMTSSTLREGTKAPTIDRWRDMYFTRRTDLGEGTETLHRTTFAYLIQFLKDDGVIISRISRETASEFRLWLARLRNDKGETQMGAATVAGHIRNCKVIFAHALKVDLLDLNPFDRESGAAPKVERSWAQIDAPSLAKILDACPDGQWRILFALCRWTGLRRGEALRLTWADVDWKDGRLTVRPQGGTVTTKQRTRLVPIRPSLMAMLVDRYESPDAAAGPCVRAEINLDRDARVIISRALGAVYAKPFHTLRKCCESEWMAEHPVLAVCEWMGHSPAVAQEHYTRATVATVEKVTKPQGVSA